MAINFGSFRRKLRIAMVFFCKNIYEYGDFIIVYSVDCYFLFLKSKNDKNLCTFGLNKAINIKNGRDL